MKIKNFKNIILLLLLIILLSVGYYFSKDRIYNNLNSIYNTWKQNNEISNFNHCVNSSELVTVLNTSLDKRDLVVYINYYFPQEDVANKVEFNKSFGNLFKCSLTVNNWDHLFVNRIKLIQTYTIDDAKFHLNGYLVYDIDFPKNTVEEIMVSKDIRSSIVLYAQNAKIGYYDLSSSAILFAIEKPNGDINLAIKRYVEFTKTQ